MAPLDLVTLEPLIARTRGRPEVVVGLVDGPVALDHPDMGGRIREIPGIANSCHRTDGRACLHGTFVAGILCGRRGSRSPAICPECTLLVRPVFAETGPGSAQVPRATPLQLAAAIVECIAAGARVINLSLTLERGSGKGERELQAALDSAAARGVVVVAAAGNQGAVGAFGIPRHPWVVPVAACDHRGAPVSYSNVGRSIGRRGLTAPGEAIESLGPGGEVLTLGGTSVATPFVTGTVALLWSEFPAATAREITFAIVKTARGRRTSVVPPLLNAWAAYRTLLAAHSSEGSHGPVQTQGPPGARRRADAA